MLVMLKRVGMLCQAGLLSFHELSNLILKGNPWMGKIAGPCKSVVAQ